MGQTFINAFTNVASGIAKNTPQKPQTPPNTNIATIIAIGCKLTASENKIGNLVSTPGLPFGTHLNDVLAPGLSLPLLSLKRNGQ